MYKYKYWDKLYLIFLWFLKKNQIENQSIWDSEHKNFNGESNRSWNLQRVLTLNILKPRNTTFLFSDQMYLEVNILNIKYESFFFPEKTGNKHIVESQTTTTRNVSNEWSYQDDKNWTNKPSDQSLK